VQKICYTSQSSLTSVLLKLIAFPSTLLQRCFLHLITGLSWWRSCMLSVQTRSADSSPVSVCRLFHPTLISRTPGIAFCCPHLRGCIQRFPDWVDNEINNNNSNNKHSLRSSTKVVGEKLTRLTHKIATQLHLVAESCTIYSSRSRRPARKLLDTLSYLISPYVKVALTCILQGRVIWFNNDFISHYTVEFEGMSVKKWK
jgi:hypothetical protein